MAGVWLWVRSEWRRGWAGLLVLGLLITVAGSVTLAVAAGSRRADSAIDRFMIETNQHHLEAELVLPDDLEEAQEHIAALPSPTELADRLSAVPGVEGVAVMDWIAAAPHGSFFFNAAMGATRGRASSALLVDGRWADPANPHEVVVGEAAIDMWGAEVGETLTLESLAPDQIAEFMGLAESEPKGPTVDVRVVGVMRDVEEITDAPEPWLIATPAFLERYDGQVAALPGVGLVTADPDRLDDVAAGLQRVVGDDYSVAAVDEDFAGRIDESVSVEVIALWVFAAVAASAGLIIVYQAMSRHAAQLAHERGVCVTLGFSRRDQVAASVLRSAPAVLIGVIGSVAVAVALSPVFPRGLARRAEPNPGVLVDETTLLVGALAILAVCLAMAFGTAWSSRRRAENPGGGVGADSIARLAAALPPSTGLGVRFALSPMGRRVGLGWAGVVAVAIGVAGLLTVAAVDRSAEHLMATPRLFGANVDVVVGLTPESDADAIIEQVAADPDVVAVGRREMLVREPAVEARGPGGESLVEPEAVRAVVGSISGTMTDGRLPDGPGEVVIGDSVADRLGAEIGDTIEVDGRDGPVRLIVVGRIITAGNDELGNGFNVTHDGLELIGGAECAPGIELSRCGITTQGLGAALRPGADVDGVIARLAAIDEGFMPMPLPSEVNNLNQIGSTPWLLAAFLALLGLGGLAHALTVGSGRRLHDLAVARALGFRPAQAAQAVRGQAVVLAIVGAAIGTLAGVVAGRLVWQRVAEGIGAVVETVVPAWAWVAAPLAALALAVVVALVPASRAAALRPAELLRTE